MLVQGREGEREKERKKGKEKKHAGEDFGSNEGEKKKKKKKVEECDFSFFNVARTPLIFDVKFYLIHILYIHV